MAGSAEGRRLNDGRITFTLAGRVSRAYRGTISIRTFLAGLAHRVEGLNYPEPRREGGFQVNPYGFEAEVGFPLGENQRVRLYIETCNGMPKIAQIQAYCFLIMRRDFYELDRPDWLQQSTVLADEGG